MISIEELAQIKDKKKTQLYYEEKEYLQHIFLNALSRYSKDFVFKGGTCLRICYGLKRASEDLDFSSSLNIRQIKEIIRRCLKDFEFLNIKYSIYAEKEFEGNFRTEARFEGPLFVGKTQSTNTLKIDFNKNKVYYKVAKVIPKLFSDVPLFTIFAMDEKEILAEKIRALINRKEPRDLYDFWMLLNKGTPLERGLIEKKLKEENSKLSSLKLPTKEEYEKGLKDLISLLPPYEQVANDTKAALEKLK